MRNPLEHCRCVNCGWSLQGVALINARNITAKPDDGDITVCLYCGHIMCFAICTDGHVMLRDPNDREIVDIAGRPDILAFQKVRKDFLADMEKYNKKSEKKSKK